MEQWEKLWIRGMLPDLLENTKCSAGFLAYLQSANVLSGEEAEKIESKTDNTDRVNLLYKILPTRKNGYQVLARTLFLLKQSGSFQILLEGYRKAGGKHPVSDFGICADYVYDVVLQKTVSFQNRVCSLQECTKLDTSSLLKIIKLKEHEWEVINIMCEPTAELVLVSDTIPAFPSIYIPRKLSSKVILHPKLFSIECPDIFVFLGLDRPQLTSIAKGQPTQTSLECRMKAKINHRFILLEHKADWLRLCELAKAPIHLIKRVHETEIDDDMGNETDQEGGCVENRDENISSEDSETDEDSLSDHYSTEADEESLTDQYSTESDEGALRSDWYIKTDGEEPFHDDSQKYTLSHQIYILEDTHGHSSIIQQNLSRGKRGNVAFTTEVELVDILSNKRNRMCICDSPGMGKSYVLGSLARQMREKSPNQLVCYIRLQHFVKCLKFSNELCFDDCLHQILSYVSTSDLGISVMTQAIKQNILSLQIFMDGFDEIRSEYVEFTKQFLRNLSTTNASLNIYLTSRQHYQNDLQDIFGHISYKLLPFTDEDQIDYLTQFWKCKFPNADETKLEELANEFVDIIEEFCETNDVILGIPLLCEMLAVVNLEEVTVYMEPGRNISIEELQLHQNSPFKMYHKYIESRFELATKNDPEVNIDTLRNYHIKTALELISLTDAELFERFENVKTNVGTTQFFPGLLVPSADEQAMDQVEFLHQTFAEYFIAEFLAKVLVGCWPSDLSDQCRIFKFFLQTRWRLMKNPNIISEFIKPKLHESFSANQNKRYYVAEFHFYTICYFLNEHLNSYFLKNKEITFSSDLLGCLNKMHNFFNTSSACLRHCLNNLFAVLGKIAICGENDDRKNFKRYMETQFDVKFRGMQIDLRYIFMFVATEYGNREICEQLFRFLSIFEIELVDECNKIPFELVTPLHLAIAKIDYDLVEFYSSKISLPNRHLLFECAQYTYNLLKQDISKVKCMINLFLEKCPEIASEKAFSNCLELSSSVFANRVDLSIIKFFVSIDNQNEKNSLLSHILSSTIPYMSGSSYHQLICYVIDECDAGDSLISKNYRALQEILSSFSKLHNVTLEKIFSQEKVDINYQDSKGSLLHYAVEAQPYSNIKLLVQKGVDTKHKNCKGETVLHIAAKSGDLETIEFLLSQGLNINEPTNSGQIPVQYASRNLEATKLLVLKGANVMNENYVYPLSYLAATHLSKEEFTEFVWFIIHKVNKPKAFCLTCNEGQTPLHRLIAQYRDIDHESLKLILDIKGYNINAKDNRGRSLLLIAIEFNKGLEFYKALITNGADKNSCNNKNENSIHLAVVTNQVDALNYFLSIGVNTNQVDTSGNTPLNTAIKLASRYRDLRYSENRISEMEKIVNILRMFETI